MGYLKEVKKELKEKDLLDRLTKKNCVLLKQAWLKDQEQKCVNCGATDNLTIDHIVPVDIISQFVEEAKTFNEKWYQVLCYRCNKFKANKLDLANPKTKEILTDLLKGV